MDAKRTFNALTEIPESLSVGELNQAVRDLRELLHEQTLKAQENNPPKRTLQETAQLAYDVQYAVNLSGVVHSFSRAVTVLWEEARKIDKGTDWVNTHPISKLFADKCRSLTGDASFDAYEQCLEISRRK